MLEAVFARLGSIGADPDDDVEARLRKALLVLVAVIILPISFIWGVLYVAFAGLVGYTAFLYFAVSLASIAVFARTRNFDLLLRIQLIAILLAPTLSMIPLGGFLGSGSVGLWGVMARWARWCSATIGRASDGSRLSLFCSLALASRAPCWASCRTCPHGSST